MQRFMPSVRTIELEWDLLIFTIYTFISFIFLVVSTYHLHAKKNRNLGQKQNWGDSAPHPRLHVAMVKAFLTIATEVVFGGGWPYWH